VKLAYPMCREKVGAERRLRMDQHTHYDGDRLTGRSPSLIQINIVHGPRALPERVTEDPRPVLASIIVPILRVC
jgi:hypothetical protein